MGKDLNNKELGTGLSQRPDGRYNARATVAGVKIDLYDTDLPQLKKKFEEEKYKLKNQKKSVDKNITFKNWFDIWFETCKSPQLKTEASRINYRRRVVNTFGSILGDKPIKLITHLNIQNATNELVERGYSERTIKEAIGGVKSALDIAVVDGIISSNPCTQICVYEKNVAVKERRVLSQEEQEIFLEEIKGNIYEKPLKILLLTGMRIGEFAALSWDDVDFQKKVIRINKSMSSTYVNREKIEKITTPKTSNSYREIPFFQETETLFKQWKVEQDRYKKSQGSHWRCPIEYGDLVFTTTLGSPANRYIMERELTNISKNINLKELNNASREGRQPRHFIKLHPHALRHTFCTRCFEKGIDPVVIQKIMGHSDYRVTLSYTHVLDDKLQSEVARVGTFLS